MIISGSVENELPINTNKCAFVIYTNKRNYNVNYKYNINGKEITRLITVKDLGVTFKSSLDFSEHISSIVQSAYRSLGFIIRNTQRFHDINALKILFHSLVRSKLEYACVVWSPNYKVSKNIIEKLQKKFLRYLHYKKNASNNNVNYVLNRPSYNALLDEFNFESLMQRRRLLQQIYLYKLVNGKIDDAYMLGEIKFNALKNNLRARKLLVNDIPRTESFKSSPLYQMCSMFNSLSTHYLDLDHSTPLAKFVTILKNICSD